MAQALKSHPVNVDTYVDKLIFKFYKKHGVSQDKTSLLAYIAKHTTFLLGPTVIDLQYISNRVRTLIDYQKQLEVIRNIPILEQRTPEWYSARNNMITASDFAQALGHGKFGTQKQFYEKKCGYEPDNFDQNNPALLWGVKYEAVAIQAYTVSNNNMKVYEFGLLQHPEIRCLGASPDGISEMGIMLEIKCPFKRKITGEIPDQYYYQMQGQLDVCGLDECDYLECEFLQYDNEEDFLRHFNDNQNYKGVFVDLEDKTRMYIDPELWPDAAQQIDWLRKMYAEQYVTKTTFWQLNTYSVIRVYKDLDFVNTNNGKLQAVWENVSTYKNHKKQYDEYIESATKPKARSTMQRETMFIDTKCTAGSKKAVFTGYSFVDE
jgi:putative phage-type endonuclease